MLEVQDIVKKYGDKSVLSGISFQVNPGELVALVGPNGVGKSTLLNIISNTVEADQGEVRVKGRSHKDRLIFDDLSVMLGADSLYPQLTGYDHLTYVAGLHQLGQEMIDQLVQKLGMEAYVKKAVAGYSMGMKQKLLFALAILPKPKVLILDEPHVGLDPTNMIQQREVLLELQKEGTAIVLSSHHLAEIEKLTDRVYFLKDGQLVERELPEVADYDYHLIVNECLEVEAFLKDFAEVGYHSQRYGQLELFLPASRFLTFLHRIPSYQIHSISKNTDYMEGIYRELYVEEGGGSR